jgi:hypothetical protein
MPCSALFSGGVEFGCVTDKALASRQTGLSRQFKTNAKKISHKHILNLAPKKPNSAQI